MPRPSPQTDRVVGVISMLAERPTGATLTEVAQHLEMDRSTCVHMLAALTRSGFLVRESTDRRYHLGPALVAPGRVAAERYPHLAVARAEMAQISRSTGLPCCAFAREGDHARLVAYTWDEGDGPPEMRLGDTVPLVPPLGALFFAWGPREDVEHWFSLGPVRSGEQQRYREQLRRIRRSGHVIEARPPRVDDRRLSEVVDDRPSPQRDGRLHELLVDHDTGEHLITRVDPAGSYAVHGIGAPVLDPEGRATMSLHLIGFDAPVRGSELRRLAALVRAAATRTSAALEPA
ncbi:MAG: helix-turn-helix domain-containing protein [Microthrixaceae bacterium]